MKEVTTKSGFSCTVNPGRFKDDYRFVRTIARLEKANDDTAAARLDDYVDYVLGDQADSFLDHIVETTGGCSVEDVVNGINEILMLALGADTAKNSGASAT